MKRISVIICRLVLILCVMIHCGCSGKKESVQLYGYQSLRSDAERRLYDEVDSRIQASVPAPFAYDTSVPQKRVWEIIDIYVMDHPDVFWIRPDAPCTFTDGTILLTYTAEGEQLETMRESLEDVLQEFHDSIAADDTPYVIEQKINAFIIERCSYDQDAVEDGKYYARNELDAYGALVDGKAICEGYARAAKLLLDRCGIRNVLVLVHMADSGAGHIVNALELDGEWYYLDVTNNDKEGCPARQYAYFNITTARLETEMTIDPLYSEETLQQGASLHNVYVPECTGTAYNWYTRELDVLDTHEYTETIIPTIAAAAKEGKTWYAFRVEDTYYYEDFRAWLFDQKNIKNMIWSVSEYNGNEPKLDWNAGGSYDLSFNVIAVNLVPVSE